LIKANHLGTYIFVSKTHIILGYNKIRNRWQIKGRRDKIDWLKWEIIVCQVKPAYLSCPCVVFVSAAERRPLVVSDKAGQYGSGEEAAEQDRDHEV
jgi:hypothetical protein